MSFESELTGVMVDDCFVLGWRHVENTLIFEIEASLWPGNPHYEEPKPGDWTCYKRSKLVFSGVREVSGLLPMHQVRTTTDPNGTKDYGTIDVLTEIPGGFKIIGEFGDVTVIAEDMWLDIQKEA